jgi:hypothetical protein
MKVLFVQQPHEEGCLLISSSVGDLSARRLDT